MAVTDPVLSMESIVFSYNEQPLLRGLNLELKPGEKVGLTGPNGSGKTTLFQLIMGLLRPAAGEIRLFGRPCSREADFAAVRGAIAMQFQDPDDQLFCPTVAEDIAFGPLNLGADTSEAKRRVSETLEVLGLGGFEERVTHHLSEGEKRLISLGTLLAMKPEILLLDEPTAGLDEAGEARVAEIVARQGAACLLISHDQHLIGQTCSRTLQLRNGLLTE